MRLLSRAPLEQKLTITIMSVTMIVLVLAFVSFLAYDRLSFRQALGHHIQDLASVAEPHLTEALVHDRRSSLEHAVRQMSKASLFEQVIITDSTQRVVYAYPGDTASVNSLQLSQFDEVVFDGDHLRYARALTYDGRPVGGMFVYGSLSVLNVHLGRYLGLITIFLVLGPLVAFLVTKRLSRLLSRPIAHLTQVAGRISQERDYTLRAEKTTEDEIGYLIETFNDMLNRIGEREAEVHRVQQELESWTHKLEQELQERGKTEEALRLSQERLSSALRVARMGSFQIDIRNQSIWGSEEAFALYGLDRSSSNVSLAVTEGQVHPDDRERKSMMLKRFLAGEGAYDIEFRITRASDNARRYIHSKARLVRDEDGTPIFAEGVIQDITDRKLAMEALYQSEQMLQLVLNNIPQRVFWKDLELRYIGCNQSFADDAGLNTALAIIGKSDYELIWRQSAEQYRRDDREVMESNRPKLDFEEPQELPDGTIRWLRSNKTPLHDRDGNVIGVLGTYEDVTERRRAEQQRDELQLKLDRAQRMESLGILAGGVAHDLNNMLGPMVGYPELILRTLPDDSPMRRQIEKISSAARNAADVIQDLLALARRGRYEMKPLHLTAVVRDYLESGSFESLRDSHPGITVECNMELELPYVLGSSSHLSKVVMNLVVNAFDAMHESGSLTIETGYIDVADTLPALEKIPNGQYVVLTVRDTGSGIKPGDLGKIFEPYYSKKKMKLGGGSGSGLGLSVVYGILKDHKGFYDVQSQPDEGTVFRLFFPCCPAPDEEVAETPGAIEGNESLLVVDDSDSQRDIARELLEALGYHVYTAENGRAALRFLDSHEVDLVILDMIMEDDFDGLDTFRAVRAIYPQQKAIIVSGYSATERVNEMQKLGAGAYIKKPYTLEQIGRAIRSELSRKPVASR